MLFIRADALGRAGLAMWTWLLGEKIHWLSAGLIVEHVDWHGQDQPRSRLVRQWPT
jgi:hypothetical protein